MSETNRSIVINEIFEQLRMMRNHMFFNNENMPHPPLFPAQAQVIIAIEKSPKIKQSELSKLLNITPSAITQTINSLEKAEMINKTHNLDDKREHHLELTNKAKSMIKKFKTDQEKCFEGVFDCLTNDELLNLKSIQNKVINNLIQNKK